MARKSTQLTSVLKQTKAPSRITKPTTRSVKLEALPAELSRHDPVALNSSPLIAVKAEEPYSDLFSLDRALAHLKSVDARFDGIFRQYTPIPWTEDALQKPKNHFKSLVLGVLSQQVSGSAARSIGKKFVALFFGSDVVVKMDLDPEVKDELGATDETGKIPSSTSGNAAPANSAFASEAFPTAEQVANSEVLFLKSAGLSLRKAEYVQGIAQAFVSGTFTDEFFATENDETIRDRLVSIRGLGPWSAEMFMMFSLNRWDVLSPGDIGIQRGLSYWVGNNPKDKSKHNKNKSSKYMTEPQMLAATDAWRPYRSIGCWAMWRIDSAVEHEHIT